VIDRRTFLSGTGAMLFAAPLAAEGQQSPSTARAFTPTVGMVTFTPAFHDSFVSALRQLGYEEGRNIVIDWRRSPTGEQPDLEKLIRRKPDCLLLAGRVHDEHRPRRPSCPRKVLEAVAADGPLSGARWDVAPERRDALAVFIEPNRRHHRRRRTLQT
jgi:hypothetical protein